ncbi:MAG: hypothetical protein MUP82_10805, partial [Candidatus Marinimicrobia bacterium]|nr:hypothetical protein [Candidatus Neomarinimicrobiota bacterium]
MKNNRQIIVLVGVLIILTIPFVLMQFTDEVEWTIFDFIVAGVVLLSAGLICEFVIRKVNNLSYRFLICITILIALIL